MHLKPLLLGSALAALTGPALASVDAKLLDMPLANGSITAAQHAELRADLAREQEAAAAAPASTAVSALEEKLAWALKTQIKGDVRVRQEMIDIEHTPGSDRVKDRQRIRARLGAYTKVNAQTDAGIRVASGNSDDRRSTNQDLDDVFAKKDVWLDLAYIDFHPAAVPGLNLIGGKMSQPWESMGDVIWDGDINPEGAAVTYATDLGAAQLFGSAGVYTLKNNVDMNGNQFRHDLGLYSGQAGVQFAPTEAVKVILGGSVYAFRNDKVGAPLLAVNGNTTTEFELYEAFGQVDIGGLPLPLSLYGQWVQNADANGPQGDQDTAWLVGIATKVLGVGLDYNYRDVERNAVVGAFTDSDFGNGLTGAHGHKFKAKYEIDKNFAVSATYFRANSDTANPLRNNVDVNTLQIDLEAKI